jgi:radical SAM-linked protein
MPHDDRPQPTVPRQRWRIVFHRDEGARFLAHLDAMKLWERALRRAGIPVANTEGYNPRPRIVFAAPLPLGMLAEREIVDVVLSERHTVRDLRERLERDLPGGFGLVDLHDVWVNAPSVASQLASATYRVDIAGADGAGVRRAVADLLAAEHIDRERQKDKRAVTYDLRPLILSVEVLGWDDADGGRGTLRIVVRHSQDAGTGRPEEVVAEIAARVGRELAATRTVRECLTLVADD